MMINRQILRFMSRKWIILPVVMCCVLTGCNDELSNVLDENQAEYEAKNLLARASYLENDPNINIIVPEVYTNPPKILTTTEGVKLFYFTRNKSPKSLAALVKAQMKVEAITESTGTNQLIINCIDEGDAHEILSYIEKIDVAPIQIKIDCMVIENYADFTMDRDTKVQVASMFGNEVITGPYDMDTSSATDLWGWFPGAALREPKRGTYGMAVGYDSKDVKFLIDMLVSRGYLKVMMNPVVRTVANKPATIVSRDRVPITKIVTAQNIEPYNFTEYTWVEDSLTVTPSVYADGSIGLAVSIKFGSKNTPEGVVQLRIITERSIQLDETRVPIGRSLVIGGFKKSEKYSVIRGFPFLKDLPIIGFLFSSKDYEERAKEITFILTPSISSEGMDYNDMVNVINELHKDHSSESSLTDSLVNIVSDPLGGDGYTKEVEHQAAAETIDRMRAEVESAQSEREAELARQRLVEYEAKIAVGSQAKQKAQTVAKEYAEKLKMSEEAKAKLDEALKSQTEKSAAEIELAKAEYGKYVAEVAELKAQVDQANAQVEQSQKLVEQATAEMNKLLEQKARMEAEKTNLEKLKIEAHNAAEKVKAAEAEAAKKAAAEAKAAEAARQAAVAAEQKRASEDIIKAAERDDPFTN